MSKNIKKYKRKIVVGIIFFLFVLVGFTLYSYYVSAKTIKNSVDIIRSEISATKENVLKQDFVALKESVRVIDENTVKIKKELDGMRIVGNIPFVKKEIIATREILSETSLILGSVNKLIDIGSAVYKDIGLEGGISSDFSFSDLSSDQKGNMMVALREVAPVVKELKNEISNIEDDIDVLIKSPLASKFVDEKILTKASNFSKLDEVLELAVLGIEQFPDLIGYFDQSNYLFLLQNNTELRPTGGFIGTYGLIQLKDSKLENLFIDDVYNLDKTVKKTMFVEPPWQLAKWNDTSQWFLRDVNWSPDFPTSAKKAEWFYNKESGQNMDFAGVIAITPDVIADIIGLFGNITVDGITFTANNFVEMLEYEVEVKFRELGIPLSERKKVIMRLSDELQKKLKKPSIDQLLDLALIAKNNLNEKQILLFFNNEELQKVAEDKNWAGKIRTSDSDYLMVIDANIGSLKTDAVMDKEIDYKVRLQENEDGTQDLIAKVDIKYINNGKFTWYSTRYRTYTRVYAPLGSELVRATGMMANDRTKKVGEVKTEDEFGKTVFGAFISIEPKDTGTLSFEYRLPDNVKKQFEVGEYKLLVQKQAGTEGHVLNVDIENKFMKSDLQIDRDFDNKIMIRE